MSDSQRRRTVKSVKLVPETHARLKRHCREGETLSGCVDRALDALEREDELPDAVTETLREPDAESNTTADE
jgi:hypothetical protein